MVGVVSKVFGGITIVSQWYVYTFVCKHILNHLFSHR